MSSNCCQPTNTSDSIRSFKYVNGTLFLTTDTKTISVDIKDNDGLPSDVDPQEIQIPLSINSLTVFSDVIPVGRKLTGLYVEGNRQTFDVDYRVVGRTVTWISPDFNLIPSLILIITVE